MITGEHPIAFLDPMDTCGVTIKEAQVLCSLQGTVPHSLLEKQGNLGLLSAGAGWGAKWTLVRNGGRKGQASELKGGQEPLARQLSPQVISRELVTQAQIDRSKTWLREDSFSGPCVQATVASSALHTHDCPTPGTLLLSH
jgi:hypothetical protein